MIKLVLVAIFVVSVIATKSSKSSECGGDSCPRPSKPTHERASSCACEMRKDGVCPCFKDKNGNIVKATLGTCSKHDRRVCFSYSKRVGGKWVFVKEKEASKEDCACPLHENKCPCFRNNQHVVVKRKECPCETDSKKLCECFVELDDDGQETESRFFFPYGLIPSFGAFGFGGIMPPALGYGYYGAYTPFYGPYWG